MTSKDACRLAITVGALALAGCSLFGSDSDFEDLEPGTFRFRVDGRAYAGVAAYSPNVESDLEVARIDLIAASQLVEMELKSDGFLTASSGDRIEPGVTLQASGFYVGESGSVEVISASSDHIHGSFRLRLREVGQGPLPGGSITTEGGFYAVLSGD